VQVAVDGEVIGDYREGSKSIDLTIMAKRSEDAGVERLRDVPMATNTGRVVPLSAVNQLRRHRRARSASAGSRSCPPSRCR
jgi:multidrug efflux pump subunit AcrB